MLLVHLLHLCHPHLPPGISRQLSSLTTQWWNTLPSPTVHRVSHTGRPRHIYLVQKSYGRTQRYTMMMMMPGSCHAMPWHMMCWQRKQHAQSQFWVNTSSSTQRRRGRVSRVYMQKTIVRWGDRILWMPSMPSFTLSQVSGLHCQFPAN